MGTQQAPAVFDAVNNGGGQEQQQQQWFDSLRILPTGTNSNGYCTNLNRYGSDSLVLSGWEVYGTLREEGEEERKARRTAMAAAAWNGRAALAGRRAVGADGLEAGGGTGQGGDMRSELSAALRGAPAGQVAPGK